MSEESPKSERSRIRPDEINAFVKRNILTILAGIIAVLVVYITALPDGRLLDPLSTNNVVRILLVGIFFILLIFGRHDKYQLFRVANSVVVPVTVVMILIYIWLDAWGADELSREDRVIENFSYLFPLVGTACLGIVAILLLRKREILTALVSLLGAGVFFVIAMEEVSWFQRVLDVETSEFFLNLNDQGEMNFHNMYTHESEDIYYLGGFLLLAVLPFFREPLGNLLDRLNLSAARVLLPPAWLILPFVLAGAFVSQNFVSRAANITLVLGSLILLVGMMYRHSHHKQWGSLVQAISSFSIMLFAIVLILSLDLVSQNVRPWIGKEYQEFYIAWGIAAYGVSVVFQYLDRQSHQMPAKKSEQA